MEESVYGSSPQEMAKLEGEWSMVSGSASGQSLPEEIVNSGKRVCKHDCR